MLKTVLAAVCAAALITACHDDDDHAHETTYPSCEAISEACHPFDLGQGPAHDCHELAHGATSDATCAARKDACLKTCSPADGGASDAPSGG